MNKTWRSLANRLHTRKPFIKVLKRGHCMSEEEQGEKELEKGIRWAPSTQFHPHVRIWGAWWRLIPNPSTKPIYGSTIQLKIKQIFIFLTWTCMNKYFWAEHLINWYSKTQWEYRLVCYLVVFDTLNLACKELPSVLNDGCQRRRNIIRKWRNQGQHVRKTT